MVPDKLRPILPVLVLAAAAALMIALKYILF